MKKMGWQIMLGVFLILLSTVLYYIHFLIFRDPIHIFKYLLGDIAFLPIEVLLVTVIIHQLLDIREKQSRMDKLNMVIGVFYSEVGTSLLTYLSGFDPNLAKVKNSLMINKDDKDIKFDTIKKELKGYSYSVNMSKIDLSYLKDFLSSKRDFLLRLLENPNLIEHESFTGLLQSVFHLTEELSFRKNLSDSTGSDREHIGGDIDRVYNKLVNEWVDYVQHLKNNFPYLFSLALRVNPFDPNASAAVKNDLEQA